MPREIGAFLGHRPLIDVPLLTNFEDGTADDSARATWCAGHTAVEPLSGA